MVDMLMGRPFRAGGGVGAVFPGCYPGLVWFGPLGLVDVGGWVPYQRINIATCYNKS